MEIRSIKPEEVSLILSMWKRFAEDQFQYSDFFQKSKEWHHHLEQLFNKSFSDSNFLLAGAFIETDLIGYVFAQLTAYPKFFNETGYCNIRHLFIEDGYRNNNYGEQLLRHAVNWSKRKGVNRIEVMVISGNEKALRFYSREGFEEHIRHLVKKV